MSPKRDASRPSLAPARRASRKPAAGVKPAAGAKPAAGVQPKLVCHPLTPERWGDLERLFGPRGACAGCWCMYPRTTRAEGTTSGEPNRRAFQKVVTAGPPPGLLAYVAGEPVGWIAIAPRADYLRFERSRVLKPVDDEPVWSVPCFFVARAERGRGLTVKLLRAACDWAASHGARIVEGYPVDPKGAAQPAAFVFPGLVATFKAAGFHEVLRRSERRPIMRRTLRRSSSTGPRAHREV